MNVITVQNNEITGMSVDNEIGMIPDGRYVRLEDMAQVEESPEDGIKITMHQDDLLVILLRTAVWLARFKGDPRKNWGNMEAAQQKLWLRDAYALIKYQEGLPVP